VKGLAWVIFGIIVFLGALICCFVLVYRSPLLATIPIETSRKKIDELQNQAFIRRSSLTLFLNRLYGNADKYVFRPPRILPTFDTDGTVQGYVMYGMVTRWDPQARLLTLSSYLGRPVSVRFDPDLDRSFAVVPRLDGYGVAQSVGESDFVQTSQDPRYTDLFCENDVVSVETPHKQQFSYVSRGTPIVPRSIQLSFRLCDK